MYWKGGRILDKDGYVMVYRPDHYYCNSNGYIREHRLIMELHVGRLLKPREVVHHKDGDRVNNKISNLELLPHKGAHSAIHCTRGDIWKNRRKKQ